VEVGVLWHWELGVEAAGLMAWGLDCGKVSCRGSAYGGGAVSFIEDGDFSSVL
jgi:hypothetical protein